MKVFGSLSALVLVAASACGGATTSAEPTNLAPGVSKTEVKVGMTCGFSASAVATLCEDAKNGTLAYMNEVNAKGGVHGRKLKLVTADEQYQAAQALTAAKQLVENEKILALLVPAGTTPILAYADYAKQQQVPIIAPIGALPTNERYIYSGQPTYADQMFVVARYQKEKLNVKKVGFIHVSNDAGQAGLDGMKAAATTLGLTLTTISVPATQTTFSSEVAKFRDEKVDGILSVFTPTGVSGFVKELERQSFNVPFGGYVGTTDLGAIDVAGTAAKRIDSAFSAAVQPESNAPEVKSFLASLKASFPQQKPRTWTIYAYAFAQVFANVLERAGANPTKASFDEALNSTKGFKTGLIGPVTWSVAGGTVDHVGVTAGQVVKWTGSAFEPQTDFVSR